MTEITSESLQAGAAVYSEAFYAHVDSSARSSAEVVVPLVMNLLAPSSVIDFGCGRGVWLAVFRDFKVNRILGTDGPWVDESRLAIPKESFQCVDLSSGWTPPSRFDLAVCLEVGEHLPDRSSEALVASLAGAAPAVLFSSAIPGQGGTNHINEQWPEYWRQKFAEHDYIRLDPFRRMIWQDGRVAWFYQQNLYLYVARTLLDGSEDLQREFQKSKDCALTLVHPKILRPMRQFRPAARLVPQLFFDALRRSLVRIGSRTRKEN